MKFKNITLAIALLLTIGHGFNCRADGRFPVLTKLEPGINKSFVDLLEWQRKFDEMSESQLIKQLGEPVKRQPMSNNPVTKEPMTRLSYHLSRRSELHFTIHQGKVNAVDMIIMPSANDALVLT